MQIFGYIAKKKIVMNLELYKGNKSFMNVANDIT